MSSSEFERVRSDLSTIREALGLDSLWSTIDVRFCGVASAAAGVYALLSWPDLPVGIAARWAAAPLLAVISAYLVYMAIKARSLPSREQSRRREYRSTLVALAVALPAVAVYLVWGKHAGMTGMQLRGSILALIGIAFLIVGIAQPPLRYPRSYLIVGAIPLIAFGLAIPLAPQPYYQSLIGLLGLVELGMAAMIIHRHVRRQLRQSTGGDDVAD
jgi:phosphate/sulfate permease